MLEILLSTVRAIAAKVQQIVDRLIWKVAALGLNYPMVGPDGLEPSTHGLKEHGSPD